MVLGKRFFDVALNIGKADKIEWLCLPALDIIDDFRRFLTFSEVDQTAW